MKKMIYISIMIIVFVVISSGCSNEKNIDLVDGNYQGETDKKIPNGNGVLNYTDGRIFEGIFKDGKLESGKMSYLDGSIYDGTWETL